MSDGLNERMHENQDMMKQIKSIQIQLFFHSEFNHYLWSYTFLHI